MGGYFLTDAVAYLGIDLGSLGRDDDLAERLAEGNQEYGIDGEFMTVHHTAEIVGMGEGGTLELMMIKHELALPAEFHMIAVIEIDQHITDRPPRLHISHDHYPALRLSQRLHDDQQTEQRQDHLPVHQPTKLRSFHCRCIFRPCFL